MKKLIIKDMADLCEEAHRLTVKECKKKGINVDCTGIRDCGDDDQRHTEENLDRKTGLFSDHYSFKATPIFEKHYDYLVEKYNI